MYAELPSLLHTNSGLVRAYPRPSFDAYLPALIETAHQQQDEFALVMLEIDHFKSINDAFGHLRGDAALREFAERIHAAIRPEDRLFRYGGDEFVLILPATNFSTARLIAHQTLAQINQRPFTGDPPLTISVSGGMAMFPADTTTSEELFTCADQRCRRAKQIARGQLIVDDSQTLENEPLVKEPSRLLERDQELEQLHRFIETSPHNPVNILRIAGPAGVGKRRLMREARAAARLHGFATLDVQGRPGLETRIFGGLADARLGWREVLVPELGVSAFINGLRHIVSVSGHRGMIITVENLAGVDRASLDFLGDVLMSEGMNSLALIYADGDVATGDLLWANLSPTHELTLSPLSQHGLRVWLRHSLRWEAPASLIEWLFQQTQGLPACIERVLKHLVANNLLQRQAKGWSYPPELTSLELPKRGIVGVSQPINHLPKQPANFIGREHQIRALHELLCKKALITLVGPGGIGKTRLALQVASEVMQLFPDGAFYIPLAALATGDDLLLALAAALPVPLPSQNDLQEALFTYLHNKRALLIFDHLAHRHNGETLLTDLLNAAPNLTLLITTRDQINLPYQALIEVDGLSYPEAPAADDFERYEAVQLFLRSTQLSNLPEPLSPECKGHVARICQLIHGVPLALELAASFTRNLTVAEIAAGLEKSLVSFVTDQTHHQLSLRLHYHSLLAVFDSFKQSLSETEQEVLGRLAVFNSGFTAHAANAVAGASPFFLGALTSRSYLRRLSNQRYLMHEMLRQYSLEWLSAAHFADAHTKHCYYYAAYVAAAEARMATQPAVTSEFAQEVDNIRAAWQWAVTHNQIVAIKQICGGLATFYQIQGRYQEAQGVLDTGLSKLAGATTPKGQMYFELWLRMKRTITNQTQASLV